MRVAFVANDLIFGYLEKLELQFFFKVNLRLNVLRHEVNPDQCIFYGYSFLLVQVGIRCKKIFNYCVNIGLELTHVQEKGFFNRKTAIDDVINFSKRQTLAVDILVALAFYLGVWAVKVFEWLWVLSLVDPKAFGNGGCTDLLEFVLFLVMLFQVILFANCQEAGCLMSKVSIIISVLPFRSQKLLFGHLLYRFVLQNSLIHNLPDFSMYISKNTFNFLGELEQVFR